MTTSLWMLYGANGYTGELAAREAVARGLTPVLAGRNRHQIESLAADLGLPSRVLELDDRDALHRALTGVDAVLHCAGPFVHTSPPMVAACLETGTHYLDITGEIPVFEAIARQGSTAKQQGVVLLPGVGFDVVPTDCLAASLARNLPTATHLELAFASDGGSWSRGTLKTMIESLPAAGAERRDGRIEAVPLAHDVKRIEFSCGSRWAVTIPWGDVSTAFHTTGIPNIRVYVGMPRSAIRRMQRLRTVLPALGTRPVKRLAQWWIGRTIVGPDETTRAAARTYVRGEVRDGDGNRIAGALETPEAYRFTATSAVECTRRVLAGEVMPGSWTPGRAFGPELLDELPGVVRR